MKMEQTECSEMSAYKIQAPGITKKENIQQNQLALKLPVIGSSIVAYRNSNQALSKGLDSGTYCK